MAAVVRVKRRVTEDPLEAFVLNSKRRREEASPDDVSTILKFAGTVQNQTESLSNATKLSKDEARTIVNRVRKEPLDQMRQRKRDEQRQNAHNERFRIVNCSRTTEESPSATEAAKEITILDIEKDGPEEEGRLAVVGETRVDAIQERLPGTSSSSSSSAVHGATVAQAGVVSQGDYVYDLYVPDVGQPELEWSEQFLENMLRVQPYDLLFDHYRDQSNGLEYSDCDSNDSNREDYIGNEYPDSDESTGEAAMRRAMNSMQIQEEEEQGELSSDEEDFYEGQKSKETGFVHTLEVDEPGFKGDVDFEDTADRYGLAYARYKKKILKAFENAKEVPTDEEESDSDRSSGSDYFGAGGVRSDDEEDCYSESEMDKFA